MHGSQRSVLAPGMRCEPRLCGSFDSDLSRSFMGTLFIVTGPPRYKDRMTHPEIGPDDPRAPDVQALLGRHLQFAHATTPLEHVHALDVTKLLDPAISFFGARVDGALVGVGALKHLDGTHAELKSMHTAAEARRRGIGRAILDHIVTEARHRGYRRVSLETGSMPAFAPARALYARAGFVECDRFGDYPASPTSTFMTLLL